MARGVHVLSLVVLLLLPPVASARVLGSARSSHQAEVAVPGAGNHSTAFVMDASGGSRQLYVLAARGGGFGGGRGGAMHAGPRFGAGRFGHPGFHRFPARGFPFREHRFRPFFSFGFAFPLYAPYGPNYYYPYNPYCDPRSAYFYPPWCPY